METAAPAPGATDAAQTASALVVLPYGQPATVCGLTEDVLGTAVETAGVYTLWDSAPGSTVPRTHFVTGLSGNCALQFTAALAIFGDPATHETTRYNAANGTRFSVVDAAYEAIKSDVCGVAEGQPCGARIGDLTERASFVTAYESFDSMQSWFEILLYDGVLIASGGEGA